MKSVVGACLAAGMVAGLALGGCDFGQQKAQVFCKNDPKVQAFVCEVKHTQGKKALNVCWDVVIQCTDGGTVKARSCQDVDSGGTASRNVPYSAFELKACKPSGLSVKNLKLKIK